MTNAELIERLRDFPPDAEVRVYDGEECALYPVRPEGVTHESVATVTGGMVLLNEDVGDYLGPVLSRPTMVVIDRPSTEKL